VVYGWNPRFWSNGALLLMAALFVSCDTPQKLALKELAKSGIEPSGRSLLRAVIDRDSLRTSLLLEARVYTEQRDIRDRSPLALAVEYGDARSAIMLLNAGANVNTTLANRASVLGIAAARGDEVMVGTLIAAGARTDGLMPDGEKILPWAIRQGRLGLVKTMMKADSDPHLKDSKGNPLLHIAMESGRRDLMESLVELGADPAATNAAGETTIHLALRQGWIDVIPKLASAGADPNAPGPDGRRLLETAVAEGNMEQAALFLKIGADPNFPWHLEETTSPLRKVFENPDPSMFKVFLNHGAKPPGGVWDPWLWKTFRNRDPMKTRLLLTHGAREPGPGAHRLRLVEAATLARQTGFVKLLLDYGFHPGRAIYFASVRGDHEMTGLLLGCGVSPDFTCFPARETALSAAIRGRHDRVAELLVRYGVPTSQLLPEGQRAFHLAVATGCSRTVHSLLQSGENPNSPFLLPVSPAFLTQVRPGVMRWVLKMDRNATPLMVAADSENIQTARYLIKAGAKTNVRTHISSLWPINFASRRNDVRMMRLFLGREPFHEERLIEIRLSEQRAWMFDAEGRELLTTKVSTGRKGYPTPTGEYVITNKHRDWTSTLYHASMPYFQRLSCGDFGLHQGYVPGYPASHGCIRVPASAAAKLFGMTQTGDRVRILP
jgi:ankyrin repeat protein